MRIPEKAPDWLTIITDSEKFKVILNAIKDNVLNEFISKIEQRDEYTYWDKFKHMDMPENLPAKTAWAYLKMTRQSKIVKTKLICKESKDFGYWIPDSILQNLSYIDKYASGHILAGEATVHKAEQKKYLTNSLMEEAIASSRLEGAATTRKIAKEMLRSGRKPKNNPEQMIYNNFQTIMKIKDLTKKPLSDKLVLRLHELITTGTLKDSSACGRFRTIHDDPICVQDEKNQILYEPPSPEKIATMMKILYDYANESSEQKFTHPVIKAINLHFYLSYIHPFIDGNGRTARAIFYWYMLKQGYWMFEYLTISRIFLKAPSRYARAFLYTEIDDSDLTYFISFHLRAIKIAISELVEYIKRKQREARETTYWLRKYPNLNERQKALLRNALEKPDNLYTITVHQVIHNITYEAARRDLLYLVKNKFLIKTKKGRKFYFIPSETLTKMIKKQISYAHPDQ